MFHQGPVNFRQPFENGVVGRQLLAHLHEARTTKTLIATASGLFNTVTQGYNLTGLQPLKWVWRHLGAGWFDIPKPVLY